MENHNLSLKRIEYLDKIRNFVIGCVLHHCQKRVLLVRMCVRI